MNCPKCGMTLPDDSEFCQYCGERIEPSVSIPAPSVEPDERKCPNCGMLLPNDVAFCPFCGGKIQNLPNTNQEKPSSAPKQDNTSHESPEDESVAPISNMLANNMVENILANRKLIKKHTSDSNYGLVPEKPIFTFMVDGAKSYLDSLVTEDNEELIWHREGSMTVKGISGPVDVYVSEKKTGEQYKTLYVSIYAEANSQSIPKGFIRKGAAQIVSHIVSSTTSDNILKKAQKKSLLRVTLIILAVVSIVLLSALNVYQFVTHKKDQDRISKALERISVAEQSNKDLTGKLTEQGDSNAAKIEELDSAIASKNATIEDQKKTIRSQEKTISSLETKAADYSAICDALKSGNIGYAADNFNCSQSIILVKKGETKKITLTANWTNGGTVSYSYSSFAAEVEFDQDSWTTSTKLSIAGIYSGINVVTFENDVNTQTFKIIIIVE